LYEFFVHIQHANYRLVVRADRPFPSETRKEQWRLTRNREANDVNAEVREAVDRDGFALLRIGLSPSEIPTIVKVPSRRSRNPASLSGTRPMLSRFLVINI